MAYERLGVGGLTEENRIFYETRMLLRAKPELVHTGWGRKASIPPRGGNTIKFRRLERPPAAITALTEGTPGSETQVTVTPVEAQVRQYGAFTRVTDVALNQSIDQLLSEFADMYGEQMGVTLDVLCRDVLVAGTNVTYTGGAGSRGGITEAAANALSATLIRLMARNLMRNNARPIPKAGGNYVAFVHPDSWNDLMGDSQIQSALQYAAARGGANPLFTGEMFDYAGVRLLRSSNARVFGSAGLSHAASNGPPAVYATVFIGEDAYGEVDYAAERARLIVKPVGSTGVFDPLDQVGSVGWKAPYGVVRLNESAIQRLEHSASSSGLQAGNATP